MPFLLFSWRGLHCNCLVCTKCWN
uniref:Uncharacterized protein n=1 Tax=Anguilla anguilla TaxID=7936 RepID=A0A0E9W662_ANGAN